MSYLETVNTKRQTTAQQQKEQTDFKAMLDELRKMQLAALMGSQGKSTVILTDQTDLGDKISDLTKNLTEAVRSIDTTQFNETQVSALRDLSTGLDNLEKAVLVTHNSTERHNAELIKAIRSLKLDPAITVPTPKVTVERHEVDFSPLQATIREVMRPAERDDTPDWRDLSRYRAQDLKDKGDTQYVGFTNPEGDWYIIENDVKNNAMRYVFGRDDYQKHFANASRFIYRLLHEAVNAAS